MNYLSFSILIYFWIPHSYCQVSFSDNNGQDCVTIGGPDIGKNCVFPFIYSGITYFGCPIDPEDSSKRWCSTLVDSNGNHVLGQGVYGECSLSCPIHNDNGQNSANTISNPTTSQASSGCATVGGPNSNAPCIFPFIYNGKTYFGCPIDPVDSSKRWCSTKVDSNGVHIGGGDHYGHCGPSCPPDDGSSGSGSTNPVSAPSTCAANQECRSFTTCSSQISVVERASPCLQSDGSPGLCCKAIIDNPAANGFLPSNSVSQESDISSVPNIQIRTAVDFGESLAQNVSLTASQASGESVIFPGSAGFSHFSLLQQTSGASQLGHAAITSMFAARRISQSENDDDNSIGVRSAVRQSGFSNADISSTQLQDQCSPTPVCNFQSKYRTIDGSCNNRQQPKYGQHQTPLQRVLPNEYADGFFQPRRSVDGTPLPSARSVSSACVSTVEISSNEYTNILMNFGQFLDHDLTHVPVADDGKGNPLQCCSGENTNFQDVNPDDTKSLVCMPIRVPPNDPKISRNCLNFARSLGAPAVNCQPGPIQQMNQITHWLDGSNIYGSSDATTQSLRQKSRGLLRTSTAPDGGPLLPEDTAKTNCGRAHGKGKCFKAGDGRVNEQPGLTTMHTLYMREHNRVANELIKVNPHWANDDEKVFQEARRIVVAQWQHTVYNEWLPIILGRQYMERFGLYPLTSGYSNDYRDDFNPSITNAFAAAAFRIGHTLIPGQIQKFAGLGRKSTGTMKLKETFFNMDVMRQSGSFSQILKGQTIQPSEQADGHFSGDIVDNLFDGEPMGFDLVALNIQRGRDHGIPGYVKYREICQVGRATSFDDLRNNMSPKNIDLLRSVYRSVEDVDLFIGMSLEDPGTRQGALVGKTFLCLIGDQFARLKLGDRYFYDLEGQSGSFTPEQLFEIRKTSLARLICDNTPEIKEMQPLAFQQPHNQNNPILPCGGNGIQRVNFNAWRE